MKLGYFYLMSKRVVVLLLFVSYQNIHLQIFSRYFHYPYIGVAQKVRKILSLAALAGERNGALCHLPDSIVKGGATVESG